MTRSSRFFGLALLALTLASCAARTSPAPVDPFPLRFPLVETGSLGIDGHVVGQPRARDGVVFYATREGAVTAVVAAAPAVLWRFNAGDRLSTGPELGESGIVIRDVADTVYVLDARGGLVHKSTPGEPITTAVREDRGKLYFGTSGGEILMLDPAAGGAGGWRYRAGAAISAGPVFYGNLVLFGCADGRFLALDRAGRLVWEHAAEGGVAAEPAAGNGRVYFGTLSRYFYCLDAASGKKRWSRRLQGSPARPALLSGGRLAVPAANSAVYFLSGRGGSIISWEAVASRVVHEAAAAGASILVTSATTRLVAVDSRTGRPVAQHLASGPLVAGALWTSPYVVLFEEAEESGRQRMVTFRPR